MRSVPPLPLAYYSPLRCKVQILYHARYLIYEPVPIRRCRINVTEILRARSKTTTTTTPLQRQRQQVRLVSTPCVIHIWISTQRTGILHSPSSKHQVSDQLSFVAFLPYPQSVQQNTLIQSKRVAFSFITRLVMSTSTTTTAARADATIPLQELQDTVSRLSSHKGVESVLILNKKGDVVAASGSLSGKDADSAEHARRTHQLLTVATQYLEGLSNNGSNSQQQQQPQQQQSQEEVSFLQIRSSNNRELMISPHEGYVLAVLKRAA